MTTTCSTGTCSRSSAGAGADRAAAEKGDKVSAASALLDEKEDDTLDDTHVSGMSGSCREEDDLESSSCRQQTLQEEMNEIIEAFFEMVGEEGLRKYQEDVESMNNRRIAENALKEPHTAPDFELEDQDGERICLSELRERGPVVLQFYRGPWCPLCNAQIARMSRTGLRMIEERGATFVGISPVLPDGTRYLSTKRDLNFPICSDVGNEVARRFNITFKIESDWLKQIDADLPKWTGDESWEVPLPATYVIDKDGNIVWSLIENDATVCAEMEDIAAAIPMLDNDDSNASGENCNRGRSKGIKHISSTFKKMSEIRTRFGRKKVPAGEFLGEYMVKSPGE